MKKYILIGFLFFNYVTFAQTAQEYEVKYAIETFFDGFHKSDSLKMKSVMLPTMSLRSIQPNQEGKEVVITENVSRFLKIVTQYAKTQNWEEELLSFKFNIDGKLAQVWVPYHFYLNGMLSHCGANSFQLFKEEDGWKIISILDTRRKNCGD